jgi:hypothetical protein
MKKRIRVILLTICVLLLLIPHVASANAPAPDPLRVKVQCRNVEVGTVMLAMFAGDDGVFHPDAEYGPRAVNSENGNEYFRRSESDTQLYLEVTHPDGTVMQSNTLPISPDGTYRYDGKTNELTDRTGSFDTSYLGMAALAIGLVIGEILAAFALTLLIEFLIGLCFRMKPYRYILFANLITNIPMNIVLLLVNSLSGGIGYWIALVVLELVVLLIEFLFYRRKYKERRKVGIVLLYTFAANAASLAAGVALLNLIF